MSENIPDPAALSDLPKGARVRLSFEGEFIGGDNDYRFVELRISDGPIRVKWEQSANAAEDYEPEVTVLDYGFKPGDVATVRVAEYGLGFRWESLFAVGTPSGATPGVRWIDSKGEVRTVDPADLTLVVRDGFAVTSED